MKDELEQQLINKYKYMFSEYDRSVKIEKLQMKNVAKIIEARKVGDKEEEAKLKEESKKIGCFHPIAFGFECDDGWYDLLDRLMEKISKLDKEKAVVVHQIKEKFGGLRFYIGGEIRMDIIGQGSMIMDREDQFKKVYEAIDEAESESFKTCEVCGKPGKLCLAGYWLKTVCKEHRHTKTWTDTDQFYKPVCHFTGKSQWHPDGERVIVKDRYLAKIVSKNWCEENDEWAVTLDNGESFFQTDINHIPSPNFYKNWIVTHKDYPDKEFVITDLEYDITFGWLYDLLCESTVLNDCSPKSLTPVKNEKGYIKSKEDKEQA